MALVERAAAEEEANYEPAAAVAEPWGPCGEDIAEIPACSVLGC